MFNIHVERTLDADIERVFELLSDHENYHMFRGIDGSALLEQGANTKNGVGALREIRFAGTTLRERIIDYQYPFVLGYKIEYAKPLPYQHDFGRIELEEHSDGVKAIWRSKGRISVPILGEWLFDKKIQHTGSRAFASVLKQIEQRIKNNTVA